MKVNVKDLVDYIDSHDENYAYSLRENKRLLVDFKGNLTVRVGGQIKYHGNSPMEACKAYNAITEKYVNPIKEFKI